MTDICVGANNAFYSSDEYGVLFKKDRTELIQYPIGNERTHYSIPDSVTSIGNEAFRYCSSLTSITIPNSVTRINEYAFGDEKTLTNVFYSGDSKQWQNIDIAYGNENLTNANIYYKAELNADLFSLVNSTTAFNGSQQAVTVNAPDGAGTVTTYYEGVAPTVYEKSITAPINAGKYKITVDVTEGNGYFSATDLYVGNYEITKVKYDHSNPTDLTAVYGDKLFRVKLPDTDNGYFKWDETLYKENTVVGNAGVNSFKAIYYPPSPQNYETEEVMLKVKVEKAIPTISTIEELQATFGNYLYSVSLPTVENGRFEWNGELYNRSTTVGHAGVNYFKAIFVPTDSDNYETVSDIDVAINVAKGKAAVYYSERLNSSLRTDACRCKIAIKRKR